MIPPIPAATRITRDPVSSNEPDRRMVERYAKRTTNHTSRRPPQTANPPHMAQLTHRRTPRQGRNHQTYHQSIPLGRSQGIDSRLYLRMRNVPTIQKSDPQTQDTHISHPSTKIPGSIQTNRSRPYHGTTEKQ